MGRSKHKSKNPMKNDSVTVGEVGRYTKKQLSEINMHLFDKALDGIIICDKYGNILSINPEMIRMFGYTPGEIVGENISKLMFSWKENAQHDAYLSSYFHTGASEVSGRSWEEVGRDKRNNRIPIELRMVEMQFDGDLLFIGFIRDISERKKIEKKLENERNTRSRQIVRMKERERAGQANELHEEIGQLLMVVRLGIGEITRYIHKPKTLVTYLSSLKKTIDEVSERIASMAQDLMPSTLNDFGLQKALLELAVQVEKKERIKVKVAQQSILEGFDSHIENGVYRICQEAVRNAVKYSGTKEIIINLMQQNNKLILIVRDFGAAPKLPEDKRDFMGGVSYMRERAQLLGGVLNINTSSGKGTSVNFKLPI